MARTVKPDEYASKRNEILDVALRQMVTRGFGQVVIQDILKEIQISSGAFHHYFESRDALLEAIILRILEESEKPLLPIIHDPNLSAIQKLQGFFGTLDQLRIAHKEDVVQLERVWYGDENAVVRQRMNEAVVEQRAPLLNEIVRQGIQEGIFTVAYPDQAGEIILALLQGMGDTHAKLLINVAYESEECIPATVDRIGKTHAAYMDAVEHVLGAPANCLYRADSEAVMMWVSAIRENQ
jgi:TetR/AcrR family transcriptional regulator, transcriptional repressor for nem operon